MTNPVELLREYMRGIDEVIKTVEDEKELLEIKRIRLQYRSSIQAIEYMMDKARTKN